jgi:tetratricopeptide (TPR) repeat protein
VLAGGVVMGVVGSGDSGDGARWRVFISYTSELRDFPEGLSYVAAVEQAIAAAGHVTVDMADFAGGQAPAQACAERVRGCEVYIGVLGSLYGPPVLDKPEVSYTELEFDTATEAGLDRLVFLLDTNADNSGIPALALLDREFGGRQDAFRRRVQDSGLLTQSFADPAELGLLVERSLRALPDTGMAGGVARERVQAEEAIGFYQEALQIARDRGDRSGECVAAGNLGSAYAELGQTEQAIDLYQQALHIARDLGDLGREGPLLAELGYSYQRLGQADQAVGLYEQALAVAREVGDRRGEGVIVGNLGSALAELGQPDHAVDLYQHALAIARDLDDRGREGALLAELGNSYQRLGQPDQAVGLYQQALHVARDRGDRSGEGMAVGNLGSAYAELGQTEQAMDLYQQALAIARDIGDRSGEGLWLAKLNAADSELGRIESGLAFERQPAEQRPRAREILADDAGPRYAEGSDVDAAREGDRVECSVFAPQTVSPGSTFLVQVFAHISSQTRDAMRRAKEFDADAVRRAIKTLESSVSKGTKLSFCLTMPGLRVDDPVQSLVWWGTTESVQFGVSIPKRYRLGKVVGTITVSQDWIPVGHIKFTLAVVASSAADLAHSPQSISAVGEAAKRYEMAFVSYASEDRTKVLERVQVLPIVGVRTFQDVLDLGPGERWERSLYQHIDESDIVLLFWSNAAKRSKWVRREVRYALDRKHGDMFAPPEIGPVIIEGPPVPEPWKELSDLHFNDRIIYFMDR